MASTVKDESDFKSKLVEAGDKLVVVDFYADWCNLCKSIAPQVEDMAKKMKDVVFVKVDINECESVAMDYSVSVLPTIVFIKKGEKLESLEGSKNVPKLKETTYKYK